MFDLSTRDVKYLPGVGPQRAALLNKELNIYSLRDLLYYFPYKYVDRSRLYYIHEIDGNMPYIQLRGRILSFELFGEGRQRRLVGHFTDGTGVVDLVWFQGLKYITGSTRPTRSTSCSESRRCSTGVSTWRIPTSTRRRNSLFPPWGFSPTTIPRKR